MKNLVGIPILKLTIDQSNSLENKLNDEDQKMNTNVLLL